MFTCDHVLVVTNRALSRRPLLKQLALLLPSHPAAVLLREKDLSSDAYYALANEVQALCAVYQVPCILHSHLEVAQTLGVSRIHLSLPMLEQNRDQLGCFSVIGASVHSAEEAWRAYRLGATYVIAGHIFPTACKPDLLPQGLEFLKQICQTVPIPVYAIGGISPQNQHFALEAGADKVCIMSGAMTTAHLQDYAKTVDSLSAFLKRDKNSTKRRYGK